MINTKIKSKKASYSLSADQLIQDGGCCCVLWSAGGQPTGLEPAPGGGHPGPQRVPHPGAGRQGSAAGSAGPAPSGH